MEIRKGLFVYAVSPSYKLFRYPPEVISRCVWLYHRFPLSFRNVLDTLVRSRRNAKAAERLLASS
ncbi:hypothetical protein HXP44_12015 [Streptomyces sioyaensis]|uniref:Transposase n=1 Tax=Streptomyces sioyaensis TaxID=67364 RepID=A0A4Q1R2E2_9ACTN|nr:hypothetical protein [Streptomyces sioyaensis]RXS67124.1 hypothetical protein EST54_13260 [Streptomyces sioyaensis]